MVASAWNVERLMRARIGILLVATAFAGRPVVLRSSYTTEDYFGPLDYLRNEEPFTDVVKWQRRLEAYGEPPLYLWNRVQPRVAFYRAYMSILEHRIRREALVRIEWNGESARLWATSSEVELDDDTLAETTTPPPKVSFVSPRSGMPLAQDVWLQLSGCFEAALTSFDAHMAELAEESSRRRVPDRPGNEFWHSWRPLGLVPLGVNPEGDWLLLESTHAGRYNEVLFTEFPGPSGTSMLLRSLDGLLPCTRAMLRAAGMPAVWRE
jgi:hypothetical protein